MANNPKKVKDPTEVALSAIQEALNIGDGPTADRGSVRGEATPLNSPPTSGYDDDSAFDVRSNNDRPIFEPIEEPRASRRAGAVRTLSRASH